MTTADSKKRTITPVVRDGAVESPSMKRQKKVPNRPDMLDTTFRASTKARPSLSEKGKSSPSQGRRKQPASAEAAAEHTGPTTQTSANHNKYCHFCQHVKVRASSMLACENQECCRRFCEHCLMTHLNEDVDPMSSDAWEIVDGKPVWYCPICRNRCCCSVADCTDDHRHCKAYRYRRRRAELATKRMAAVADKRVGKKPVKPPKLSIRPPVESKSPETDSTVCTPPSWAPSSTGSVWTLPDGDEDSRSHLDLEEDETDQTQESLATVVWKEESPVTADSLPEESQEASDYCCFWAGGDTEKHNEEEEFVDEGLDSFGGMYGLMAGDIEHSSRDLERLSHGFQGEVDVDEALWLRRTYETVYNPVARQKALNALVSGIASKKELLDCENLATFTPASQPARKCTVMYDFV